MSRLQKKNWNPVFIALQPSHISLIAWVLLSPFIYLSIIEDGSYGFFLGLAIGLSLMQAGYAWGQYQAHWWRFFIQNRNAIFSSPSNNHPTKKNAFNYVIAVLATYSFTAVALFITVILMFGMDASPAIWKAIKFPWDLLIACVGGAIFSMVLTKRIVKWGETKSKQLTDFSYVFETEPERQSD
jgi:hypothetical protein